MKTGKKTILHIDDDADDRELFQEVLQREAPDLDVVIAEDGRQAMALLNEQKQSNSLPCLIVLDLNMPYLNGRQTYDLIKADAELRQIPLVILSSSESPSDKYQFSQDGIDYFVKPVEVSVMAEIASHVANLC